ncbi:hypothetical protein MPTK1_5g12170 [Marchantia polymorpha subsp. ruderalis]|uniref:Uncharacterized protein n=2 Tax=Marchantia polymorpha TaxID=3197 RepID=A0AAF6BHI8_MARPO|nr:hypothetical protein MARPO_0274s0004 [Marchantia polymorpha]BBN11472.1 hypothetical protein Mp_5g12170 [Marchantia polymorpha subsp. ruderalis]|eukprot:PTQ26904.1 hypothetical protein MARPO_0274s0004 [Marchantia polymorpha]
MTTSAALTAPLVPSSAITIRDREPSEERSELANVKVGTVGGFVNGVSDGISNLANLLPTGTFLAFTTIAPIITGNGKCDQPSELWLTMATTIFFAVFCFFSCFTDSFQALDGKVYYGVVGLGGLWTPQLPIALQPTDSERISAMMWCGTCQLLFLYLLVWSSQHFRRQGMVSDFPSRRPRAALARQTKL